MDSGSAVSLMQKSGPMICEIEVSAFAPVYVDYEEMANAAGELKKGNAIMANLSMLTMDEQMLVAHFFSGVADALGGTLRTAGKSAYFVSPQIF